MTRRRLIGSLLGTAAAAAYPCYLEPRWLDLTEHHVKLARTPLLQPIRVLQISDLHASFFVPFSLIASAISACLEQKPDLICVTGDFITCGQDADHRTYVDLLRVLPSAAPTFAVLGNHDGGKWARRRQGYPDHRLVDQLLQESGIELLHNRSVRVRAANQNISLVGVGDLWSDEIDPNTAFAGIDQRDPILLLSHNPDSKDFLGPYPWDVMLSGHTHGGQVVLPFLGPRFAPVQDLRYVAGLKPWGARQIHVTRGVGNLWGVRFRCRPEVTLLLVG
jgi:predicted MPP superfamily phosphohydrolase